MSGRSRLRRASSPSVFRNRRRSSSSVKDRLPPASPVQHMANRPGILNARFPSHAQVLPNPHPRQERISSNDPIHFTAIMICAPFVNSCCLTLFPHAFSLERFPVCYG